MKKTVFTLALVLGLSLAASAQVSGGSLFGYSSQENDYSENTTSSGGLLHLPGSHGSTEDDGAPLGTGTALLIGLGAAYLVSKKNRKE